MHVKMFEQSDKRKILLIAITIAVLSLLALLGSFDVFTHKKLGGIDQNVDNLFVISGTHFLLCTAQNK